MANGTWCQDSVAKLERLVITNALQAEIRQRILRDNYIYSCQDALFAQLTKPKTSITQMCDKITKTNFDAYC
jgi:hypothetical protein